MKIVRRARMSAHRQPLRAALRPFQEFAQLEATSGILLMVATVLALLWANSPWAEEYHGLWQTRLVLGWGDFSLAKPLLLWINDGLMAVFFLVVALEIKRELIEGELSDRRRAVLPVAAALGGMVAPAALYLVLNAGTAAARGWGIPMATDIAFALGVLTLLGRHAPFALKVFLTALAIVDDLGAVAVIALFYTADLSLSSVLMAGAVILLLMACNRLGVRRLLLYGLLGLPLWYFVLRSGIHATVAGVLLAMTVPAQVVVHPRAGQGRRRGAWSWLIGDGRNQSERTERTVSPRGPGDGSAMVDSPMRRLEHGLHPLVTYGILPLFALANAGVSLGGGAVLTSLVHPVGLGVVIGLVVGKQVGITLATWLAVRLGVAELPDGVRWRHVYGAACLGGIGFTMSIFIAGLAFSDAATLDTAKRAIFFASILSGLTAWGVLRFAPVAGRRAVPRLR